VKFGVSKRGCGNMKDGKFVNVRYCLALYNNFFEFSELF